MKIARAKIATVVTATLIALCSSASATLYPHGFYIGAGLIGAQMSPQDNLTCSSGSLCSSTLSSAISLDSKNTAGAAAHFGYMMKILPIQFELSYQYLYRIQYDVTDASILTVIGGATGSGDADITNQTVFGNIIINSSFFNLPVIMFALAGYGINHTQVKVDFNDVAITGVTGTISGSTSKYTTNGAWQFGGGFYYKFTPNLFMRFTYKYQNLGETDWNLYGNTLSSGKLINNQGEIGLIYIIGDQHHPPSLITDD